MTTPIHSKLPICAFKQEIGKIKNNINKIEKKFFDKFIID
jgi:hypothetical protein